jgi:hypothetical protein
MLGILTIGIMLVVAYAHTREGFFSAFCMLINTFIAGLVAFNFWEPIANAIEASLQRSVLEGFEDFILIIALFCLTLGLLRAVTNNLNANVVELEPLVNQIGGGVIGFINGYLTTGFLICALQTLPWYQNFLGFEPYNDNEPGIRRIFPPDRVWLALMHRASETCLSGDEGAAVFDSDGAFESNYYRFRRTPEPQAEKGSP